MLFKCLLTICKTIVKSHQQPSCSINIVILFEVDSTLLQSRSIFASLENLTWKLQEFKKIKIFIYSNFFQRCFSVTFKILLCSNDWVQVFINIFKCFIKIQNIVSSYLSLSIQTSIEHHRLVTIFCLLIAFTARSLDSSVASTIILLVFSEVSLNCHFQLFLNKKYFFFIAFSRLIVGYLYEWGDRK